MKQHRAVARPARAVLSIMLGLAVPQAVLAQHVGESAVAAASPRVLDARLAHALDVVAHGSPTGRRVLDHLAASGLAVAIGTPAQLAALPDDAGGPAPDERSALLGRPGTAGDSAVAWVVFRVAPSIDAAGPFVERAWLVVDVDLMSEWIRAGAPGDAERLIEQDLLAILAHEFVAHVGSIARSRRLADFCDDPLPGETTTQPCSVRVENVVRRELNESLGLRGDARLRERASYSLDVMNFERARSRR